MRAGLKTRAAILGLLLHGCLSVTVNVSFPQEKLEGAAASIEDMVGSESPAGGAPAAPAAPTTPPAPARKPQGQAPRPARRWLAWFQPVVVEAQEVPELRTRTPEVMAAIESRRKRRPELDAAARTGCLGENNKGLVDARPGQNCPPTLGQLVAAENADRMFLYKVLVTQNSMPAEDITRVQAAFAKVRREKAAPGTWVQLENGQWTRK
jgi:uncharacterized protein YdbL (DUF1318 family)